MSTIRELYRETVQPLPASERLRLAELILAGLEDAVDTPRVRRSVLELAESFPPGPRGCATWEEYERGLREERDAWDR